MKLNNKGWGYRIFVLCLSAISSCAIVANYYIQLLLGAVAK